MMKEKKLTTIIFLLATLLLFASCGNKPTQTSDVADNTEARTLSEPAPEAPVEEQETEDEEKIETSLIFEEYIAQGFSISGNIKVYDKEMNHLKTIKMTDTISTFQIVEKTPKMYVLSDEDRNCSRVYFLKIKLDDEIFIANGSQIYTYANREDYIFKNIHYKDKNYSLYAIKPFTVGVTDEDGLSGCDDYETLIIENEKTESLHFIEGQRDDYYADKDNIKHYYLRTDDGVGESITTVSAKSQVDYIQVRIDVGLQEGSAAYDLLITEHDGSFYWKTANKKEFND